MARNSPVLAPKDPKRAARHVAYELGMLRTIYSVLRAQDPIMIEGFLLHTRNLIEFFWDHASTGAILPKDFGALVARDKDLEIDRLYKEISQLLSHLTWARVQVHEPNPPDLGYGRARQVYDAIGAKAEKFFRALSEEQRSWFSSDAFPNEHSRWLR